LVPMNSQKGRHSRILLADDDADFRFTTAQILNTRGYECVTVASADEALDLLRGQFFDLLIADINMPGNEDLSLLDYINAHVPGIPIIVVTGTPSVDTAVKSVGLNVCNYLIKPFEVGFFLTEVEKAVQLSVLRHSIDDSMSNFLRVTDQLAELRAELARSKPDLGGTASNFLTVLIGGIVDSLSAGVLAMNRIEEGAPMPYHDKRYQGAQKIQKSPHDAEMLITAIKETIETLEKTKQSFKSKELGTLRKKLNVALQVIDSKETESTV